MLTGEDPPYSEDTVLRPQAHRPAAFAPPREAVLVRSRITRHGDEEFSYFGESVAIAGDTAVVGAPNADAGWRADAGAAFVFRRRGDRWVQEATLRSPAPQLFEHFGRSVAVAGGTVVVGADHSDQGEQTDAGAAYVFRHGPAGWRLEATLVPTAPMPRAAAGFAVATSGSTAVLAAPGIDAAWVFRREGGRWREQTRLAPPSSRSPRGFGHSAAIDGDTLVVGAITDSDAVLLAGTAFVYRVVGGRWQLEAELLPPRRQELARFGAAVAVSGSHVLVSAPRAAVLGRPRAGIAWLFERGAAGWEPVQELTALPPRSDEEFGRALALAETGAVVGSPFGDAAGLNTGGAVLFDYDVARRRLVRRAALLAGELEGSSNFGFSIAANGRDVLIGAPLRGADADATGSAFVYRR